MYMTLLANTHAVGIVLLMIINFLSVRTYNVMINFVNRGTCTVTLSYGN